MITITRNLARLLRTALRRGSLGKAPGQSAALMHFFAGPEGLRIRAADGNAGIEYREDGTRAPQEIWLPVTLLAAAEGRGQEPVTLEVHEPNQVCVGWSDRGVPQSTSHHRVDPTPAMSWPVIPGSWSANPPRQWEALREAVATAAPERLRFALDCLQLGGACGQVAATDGRQLLVQGGFQLPWQDEVLVPAARVLGWKELALGDTVDVGLAGDWVSFRTGSWTISLRRERDARYPRLDDCFPQGASTSARLEISEHDAAFLARTVSRLPAPNETPYAATLDLNGQVLVRGKREDQTRPTELVLSGSRLTGDPVAIHTDRRHLARALTLGFRRFLLFGAANPILADDGERRLLWAVLDAESAFRPAAEPIRIESSSHFGPAAKISSRTRSQPMTNSETRVAEAASESAKLPQSSPPTKHPRVAASGAPVEQALALRAALLAAARQANELACELRHQRRQERLVAHTLASLQAFQKAAS